VQRLLLIGLLVLIGPTTGWTQETEGEDMHTVAAEVEPYSAVSVDPLPSLVAGPGPSKTVQTTYSVVTNRPASQSVVVSVEGTPPHGVALWVELEPPEGAQRAGDAPLQVLDPEGQADARTLVTDIGQVSETGLTVSVTTEVGIEAEPGDTGVRLSFELVE